MIKGKRKVLFVVVVCEFDRSFGFAIIRKRYDNIGHFNGSIGAYQKLVGTHWHIFEFDLKFAPRITVYFGFCGSLASGMQARRRDESDRLGWLGDVDVRDFGTHFTGGEDSTVPIIHNVEPLVTRIKVKQLNRC